jgi:hypothetical protein
MEIGEPKRVHEVKPIDVPIPETIPMPVEEPVEVPAPEPERVLPRNGTSR